MTDESKSLTEPWIERHGARYAYAYDKNGKLARYFGVAGIPDAILVDPTGRVVWRGHPASLEASRVEAHLDGALSKPLYAWPRSARPAAKALRDGKLADALEKTAAVPAEDGGAELLAELRALVEARVRAVEGALAAGDFLGAREGAGPLVKGLAGLPEQQRVEEVLERIEADPRAAGVLRAQEQIRKTRAQSPRKRKDIDRAIDQMREIMRGLPDTYAARQAAEYYEHLQELKRR